MKITIAIAALLGYISAENTDAQKLVQDAIKKE